MAKDPNILAFSMGFFREEMLSGVTLTRGKASHPPNPLILVKLSLHPAPQCVDHFHWYVSRGCCRDVPINTLLSVRGIFFERNKLLSKPLNFTFFITKFFLQLSNFQIIYLNKFIFFISKPFSKTICRF